MPDHPHPLTATSLLGLPGIAHGFFTREGGVSEGIYAGLNVGLGSDDDRAAVLDNRARVAASLGQPGAPLNTLYQVHSVTALTIDRPLTSPPPKADALVAATPGLIIGALAADCTPVLFADPETRVVAAAHAGWRGAVDGILAATVEAMVQAGADRARIRAAIGPTIHQPNYEVGPEFKDRFLAEAPAFARFFTTPEPPARPHFDLPGFVHHQLSAAGVNHIEQIPACTYADESRFFSYRRATHRKEADYGRQISAIVVT
ncbi:MAG: peptidoglycan editing factor PgeF [Pseudomonadota bacterium]